MMMMMMMMMMMSMIMSLTNKSSGQRGSLDLNLDSRLLHFS